MTRPISPITFIDKLIKKNVLGQPFRLMDHQREVLRLAFAFDENGLPADQGISADAGNHDPYGAVLFDLLNTRKLRFYAADDLRKQALSTIGIEGARGTRISKDKQSKKIDAIVALAMASVAAVDYGQTGDSILFVGVDPRNMTVRRWFPSRGPMTAR